MKIEVRSKTPALSGSTFDVPWAEVLKQNADRGAARVDRALQVYSAHLEPQILNLLFELRTSEFLARLQRLDEHVEMNTHVKFLDFPFVNAPDMSDCFGYGQFWATIRQLDRLLERDANRLRRRQ